MILQIRLLDLQNLHRIRNSWPIGLLHIKLVVLADAVGDRKVHKELFNKPIIGCPFENTSYL